MKRIQDKLDAEVQQDMSVPVQANCASSLTEFAMVSKDEVISNVKSTSNAYCDLDLIPTPLLKKNIHILAPTLVKMVNTSLQNGEVPSRMKHIGETKNQES